MKPKIIFPALLILLLAGAAHYWFFLRQKEAVPTAEEAQSLVAQVTRRTLVKKIDCAGDVIPASQVEVKAEVSGRIKSLAVVPGQKVRSGDLLAELDDRDLNTEKIAADKEIEGTQVALDKTKRNFARSQKLYEQKLISLELYEDARTDFDIAQNNYDRAESRRQGVIDRLAKTKILSPFDGTILSIPVVEGQVVVAAASVSAGTLLMTIADLRSMVISSHINQVDIAYISNGQKGEFHVESIGDKIMPCVVSFVSPMATVKNNLKGFDVSIVIDSPDPQLRPGMTADVTLPVNTASHVLTVPLAAVFTDETNESVVYVSSGVPGEITKKTVTLGVVNFDFAEIKSGVNEGDTVLLTRPAKMKNS